MPGIFIWDVGFAFDVDISFDVPGATDMNQKMGEGVCISAGDASMIPNPKLRRFVLEFIKAMGTKPVRISCRISSDSFGLASAITTKTDAIWDSTKTLRTKEESRRDRQPRLRWLLCRVWTDSTTAMSGGTRRKPVLVAACR